MAKAPWYLSQDNKPSLKHQRLMGSVDYTKDWYRRGAKLGPAADSFRKGACENCGAMTHKKKDCVERPRKVGAKFSGKDIQADEVVDGGFVLSYDGSRDRWNGYDPNEYMRVMRQYEELEEARKKAKQDKVEEMLKSGNFKEEDIAKLEDEDDDDDVKDENEKLVGQKFDAKNRTSVKEGFYFLFLYFSSNDCVNLLSISLSPSLYLSISEHMFPPFPLSPSFQIQLTLLFPVGTQSSNPRGHSQVPPQPRYQQRLLRPKDTCDAREPESGCRPGAVRVCWRQLYTVHGRGTRPRTHAAVRVRGA